MLAECSWYTGTLVGSQSQNTHQLRLTFRLCMISVSIATGQVEFDMRRDSYTIYCN